jgi:orotate phosphoribosyltransferase
LKKHGIKLHSLCTWWDVLAEAKNQNVFDKNTLLEVTSFLNSPESWQKKHMK